MRKKQYFYAVILAVAVAGVGLVAQAQLAGVTLPSVPTGVTVTAVPPSQISISWLAATESSGTIEGYYVYRNGQQITTTAGTSMVDSDLLPGIYSYTVASYDSNNNVSAQSSPASLTLVKDTTPPTVPTNVSVSGMTTTNNAYGQVALTVSWSASTDNVGVAGYYVYRNGLQIVTSTSAWTSTSYADTVTPGTYTYTVVAYDAAQNFSSQSAPATIMITVDTSAPSAPSVPTKLSIQQVGSGDVNLSWATSTDNVGVAGYQVFRNGVQIATTTDPSYADTGLSAGITYAYTVTAYDAAGNISGQSAPPTSILVESTNGPSVPDILSAAAIGTSTVNLSWVASSDVLPITSYTVYRNGTQIASVTSTNYLDEGLASGTYAYSLSATDLSGAVSRISPATNAILPSLEYIPPPIITAPIIAPSNTPAGTSPASAAVGNSTFTQALYFGLRNAQVTALQSFLVNNGYLSPADATGYFGNLTLHAVEQFQCNQNIVCTGGAGWGMVGPKTRAALNALAGSGNSGGSAGTTATTPSVSSLSAEIQALEAELANLEKQAAQQ